MRNQAKFHYQQETYGERIAKLIKAQRNTLGGGGGSNDRGWK